MNPAARERRFRRIKEIGCVACKSFGFYSAPDVHHLNTGGHAGHKRRGDECTIGLCPWHHRGIVPDRFEHAGGARMYLGPSLALLPNKFREVFGSDDELLAKQNRLIEKADKVAGGWRIQASGP